MRVMPTEPMMLAGAADRWQLVSLLALNQMSLVDDRNDTAPGSGSMVDRLRAIVAMLLPERDPSLRRYLDAMKAATVQPGTARVRDERTGAVGVCRGLDVTLRFSDADEGCSPGQMFLFASALERFLAEWVSINAFVRVTAEWSDRRWRWKPRTGDKVLL